MAAILSLRQCVKELPSLVSHGCLGPGGRQAITWIERAIQGAHRLSKIKFHDISMIFPEPSNKIPGC